MYLGILQHPKFGRVSRSYLQIRYIYSTDPMLPTIYNSTTKYTNNQPYYTAIIRSRSYPPYQRIHVITIILTIVYHNGLKLITRNNLILTQVANKYSITS